MMQRKLSSYLHFHLQNHHSQAHERDILYFHRFELFWLLPTLKFLLFPLRLSLPSFLPQNFRCLPQIPLLLTAPVLIHQMSAPADLLPNSLSALNRIPPNQSQKLPVYLLLLLRQILQPDQHPVLLPAHRHNHSLLCQTVTSSELLPLLMQQYVSCLFFSYIKLHSFLPPIMCILRNRLLMFLVYYCMFWLTMDRKTLFICIFRTVCTKSMRNHAKQLRILIFIYSVVK